MKVLKRIFAAIFLVISILSACNTSTLSFSEIENVPDKVQERVDSTLQLQLINDGKKGYYIIFQSNGNVETDLEAQGDTATIKFDVPEQQNDVVKQKTYYLTTDPKHDVIEVLVNGKSMPFDQVTAL